MPCFVSPGSRMNFYPRYSKYWTHLCRLSGTLRLQQPEPLLLLGGGGGFHGGGHLSLSLLCAVYTYVYATLALYGTRPDSKKLFSPRSFFLFIFFSRSQKPPREYIVPLKGRPPRLRPTVGVPYDTLRRRISSSVCRSSLSRALCCSHGAGQMQ